MSFLHHDTGPRTPGCPAGPSSASLFREGAAQLGGEEAQPAGGGAGLPAGLAPVGANRN